MTPTDKMERMRNTGTPYEMLEAVYPRGNGPTLREMAQDAQLVYAFGKRLRRKVSQ
jgi:hypothetical protein